MISPTTTTLLTLLSLATISSCTRYDRAAPTPVNGAGLQMALWSPAITPPPQLPGRKYYTGSNIFERADNPLSVCGYVSGIKISSVTCPDARSCFYNAPLSAAGCCYASTDSPLECGQYTSCIPSSSLSACTGACQSNSYIAKCSNPAEPHCYTFVFTAPGMMYKNLGCGVVALSENAQFTYFGQTDFGFLSGSASASATGAIRTPTLRFIQTEVGSRTQALAGAPSAGLGSADSTGSLGSGADGQGNPNIGEPAKKSSNIGAIVGGVVGGVAVIAGLIIALFILIKKDKKKKAAAGGFVAQEPKYEQPPLAQAPGQTQQQVYGQPQQGQQGQQYAPQQQFYDQPISPIGPAPKYFSGIPEIQGQTAGYQPPVNPVGGYYEQPQQSVKYEYSGQTGAYSDMAANQPVQQQQQQYFQQPQQPQAPQGPVYEAPTTRG